MSKPLMSATADLQWAARGWLGKPATMRVFDIGSRIVDAMRATLPPEAMRNGTGRRLLYDAAAIHRHLMAQARAESSKPDDPLLIGDVDSPALERYRAAKAALTEMELLTRRGEMIPEALFRQWVTAIEGRLRMAGERLQRQFGDGAALVLSETLAAMEGDLRDIVKAAG